MEDRETPLVDLRLVDIKTLSQMLSVSSRTIRGYLRDAEHALPAIRLPGGQFRFDIRDIEAWLARHKASPKSFDVDGLLEDILCNARPSDRKQP